jgi:hypothetical protein
MASNLVTKDFIKIAPNIQKLALLTQNTWVKIPGSDFASSGTEFCFKNRDSEAVS